MPIHATGSFEWKDYREQPYSESDQGLKLTCSSVTNNYFGDMEGTGTQEYLTVYRDGRPISVTGLEHFVGRVGNHLGSFVLQGSATMEGAVLKATWFVVPGSGTGDLTKVRGEGSYVYKHGEPQTPFRFDYDIDA